MVATRKKRNPAVQKNKGKMGNKRVSKTANVCLIRDSDRCSTGIATESFVYRSFESEIFDLQVLLVKSGSVPDFYRVWPLVSLLQSSAPQGTNRNVISFSGHWRQKLQLGTSFPHFVGIFAAIFIFFSNKAQAVRKKLLFSGLINFKYLLFKSDYDIFVSFLVKYSF